MLVVEQRQSLVAGEGEFVALALFIEMLDQFSMGRWESHYGYGLYRA